MANPTKDTIENVEIFIEENGEKSSPVVLEDLDQELGARRSYIKEALEFLEERGLIEEKSVKRERVHTTGYYYVDEEGDES